MRGELRRRAEAEEEDLVHLVAVDRDRHGAAEADVAEDLLPGVVWEVEVEVVELLVLAALPGVGLVAALRLTVLVALEVLDQESDRGEIVVAGDRSRLVPARVTTTLSA